MDISRAKNLPQPTIRALYAPVYWEPLPGSGERICAIVLISPEEDSPRLMSPGAHVVVNSRRLKAMLGAERGESALGILNQTAQFMARTLYVGGALETCTAPFKNFSTGSVRKARGFTAEQILDTAVHSVAAFGSTEDLLDDLVDTSNHSTASTREFLQRVQTAFAPADDVRRKRFLRSVETSAGEVTIDYVHDQFLVQFASAPVTSRQAQNMRREAESKMLETLTVQRSVMGGQGVARLIINTAPLLTGAANHDAAATAQNAIAHYDAMATVHGFGTMQVSTHEEAVLALNALL
jgi:hypothetical protein